MDLTLLLVGSCALSMKMALCLLVVVGGLIGTVFACKGACGALCLGSSDRARGERPFLGECQVLARRAERPPLAAGPPFAAE